MSVAARLLGFAAVLAAVFALAVFGGGQADLGGSEAADSASEHGGSAHLDKATAYERPRAMKEMNGDGDAHDATRIDPVRGLAVSENGLTLDLARTSAARGKRFQLRFTVRNCKGETVRDFEVEHTKRMHLIIARRDLTGFQHLHPTQVVDGSWSVPAKLEDPGTYRVFADFSTDETPKTLGGDLVVNGKAESQALPPPAKSATVDGLKVALTSVQARAGREAGLNFKVSRHGKPENVQTYLGARGHLVALREGDLAFLHVTKEVSR